MDFWSTMLLVQPRAFVEIVTLILLNSIPESYDNLVTTLMWGKETLELEDIIGALLSFNQRKKANDGSS